MTPAEACTRIGPMDGEVTALAVTAAASAAQAIPGLDGGGANNYLTLQAIDTDINVIFGRSSGLSNPTLTSNSLRIPAGFKEEWVPPPGATHYKAIGVGNGTLLIAVSSL